MVTHGKRNQTRKKIRGIRKTHVHTGTRKSGKKTCALCHSMLHGTPHGKRVAAIAKMTKSQRRPTGLFGGILCSNCRQFALEEAIRVKTGAKALEEIGLAEKNFVEQALSHLNKTRP